MTQYKIMTKKGRGLWRTKTEAYPTINTALRAAYYYKKQGNKCKIVDLKGRVKYNNTQLDVDKLLSVVPGIGRYLKV